MEVSHFIEEGEGAEENESENFQREDIYSGGSSSDEEWIGSKKKLSCYNLNIVAENQFNGFEPFYDSDNSKNYLLTPTGSDEEGESSVKKESVIYKVDNDATLKMLVWKVGMKFCSPEIFKKQLVRYAVIAGYSIRLSKSEKVKVAAKCKEGCVWRIYASWDGLKESFVVKSLNPNHTCNRQDYENIQAKPTWLAEEYLEEYRKNPNWPRKSLQQSVMERFGVRIQRFACYNVRKRAHEMLHGTLKEHYSKLASYLGEMKRVDPTFTSVLVIDKPDIPREPDIFKRLYVSFPGLRDGFVTGCRFVLCLDGCFLKTFLGGMLLCAVGRDGNNQMYPVSWAVVEAENNDSWSWFLDILKRDLPGYFVFVEQC